jgi:hypothetical protein
MYVMSGGCEVCCCNLCFMACCLVFCEHFVINNRLCLYKIISRSSSCD